MKIINKSTYQGRDLRAIIIRTMKERGIDPTYIYIYINEGKRGSIHGRAQIGKYGIQGSWVKMFIPPMDRFGSETNRRNCAEDFYRVLDHEFLHSLGVDHKEMDSECLYASGPVPYWLRGFRLREIAIQPKPTRADQKRVRYEAALAAVKRWESKAKRAANKLKAWRKKVQYHERTLPAAAGKACKT